MSLELAGKHRAKVPSHQILKRGPICLTVGITPKMVNIYFGHVLKWWSKTHSSIFMHLWNTENNNQSRKQKHKKTINVINTLPWYIPSTSKQMRLFLFNMEGSHLPHCGNYRAMTVIWVCERLVSELCPCVHLPSTVCIWCELVLLMLCSLVFYFPLKKKWGLITS